MNKQIYIVATMKPWEQLNWKKGQTPIHAQEKF
jgi:hypothetical protein